MVAILSRIQFAVTIAFHFIFVPLTIGVIVLIALFESVYYKTNNQKYKDLSEFFSEVFIINFAFGVVTGIAMTIQFGTNWANYSIFMGDVFGSPLALEALIAFFLESTFAGIWIFRRNKISKKLRLITVWLIVLGTSISALWIITANGFMQNPVGAENIGHKMVLTSFSELFFNPYTWYMMIHNHTSALALGGFFVLSVSSYHLYKGKEEDRDVFTIGAKWGAITIFVTSILLPTIGNVYMKFINTVQPAKILKMTDGSSFVYFAFAVMLTCGTILLLIGLYITFGFKKYVKSPFTQKLMVYLLPIPYIAICAGWIVTEVGRQPWIVYGELKVVDAVSQVPVEQVWLSLISVSIYYVVLGIIDFKLTKNRIKKGIIRKEVENES